MAPKPAGNHASPESVRVLLINPPISDYGTGIESQLPSLGIAYIAAVLENAGFDVRVLDALIEGSDRIEKLGGGLVRIGLSEMAIKGRIAEFSPDLIGISCMYSMYATDAYRVAELAKESAPQAFVCLGGSHASVLPEEAIKPKQVDGLVVGEGEQTFLELAEALSAGRPLRGIKGLWLKDSRGRVVKSTPRPLIENLDSLPLPARHLMPIEKHLKDKRVYPFAKKRPVLEIITSRGCPGRCVFCSIHAICGHTWRPRSAKNVVDEMEFLAKCYGVREFSILDDNVSADPKRLSEICDEIISRKLNIAWETPNGIALWTLDEPLLRKMKRSGYYRVKFGIESGCPETLRYIGKPINLEKARRVIEICNRLGIWTSSSFIIGFPDEGISSIRQTIEFAKGSGLDFARFLVAQPFPGTPLHGEFRRQGLLEFGLKPRSSAFNSLYNTRHFTARELNALRSSAESEFLKARMASYLSPRGFAKYILPKLRSPDALAYFLSSSARVALAKLRGGFL